MALYRHTINILTKRVFTNIRPEVRNIKRWVGPTLRELQRRRDKVGPPPPQHRSTFLEWNYDAEIFAFGKRLNEEFDENVLRKALTHRSYVIKQELKAEQNSIIVEQIPDNAELITRGDDIISVYLKAKFSKNYPDVLVKVIHDYLTQTKILAYVASHIGLKDIILCSDFPVEERTLADSFKAIVAALEASNNKERAERFVEDFLVAQLNDKDVYELWNPENPFTQLKTLLKDTQIEPRLCNASASNTILANYQVGLYSNKKMLGIGFGESIDIAKNMAALDAIRNIFNKQYNSN